jgi:choice-of-anchor A domain-containing protein
VNDVKSAIIVVLAWLVLSATARAGTLLMAAPYNVFMLGNFNDYGSDTEGALAAAGTITLSSFQVAGNYSPSSAFFTLVAGTDLVAVSGSVNGKVYDPTPGGIGQSFSITPGNLSSGDPSPIDFSDAAGELRALSNGLAGMATTAGDSCTPNFYYLECNATQHGLNIIDIPDTSYLGNGHAPMINATYDDATIVLNIGSAANTLTNGGWSINGVSSTHILLNFYGTTSLTFNGSVPVSVLAPQADVRAGGGGALNGSFIAYSFSGQYQFNDALFAGDLPSFLTPAPEPVGAALTGGALAALGVFLTVRRRAHTP